MTHVPDGFRLVPEEPTMEILDAICATKNAAARDMYKAVLAAAPQPPASGEGDVCPDCGKSERATVCIPCNPEMFAQSPSLAEEVGRYRAALKPFAELGWCISQPESNDSRGKDTAIFVGQVLRCAGQPDKHHPITFGDLRRAYETYSTSPPPTQERDEAWEGMLAALKVARTGFVDGYGTYSIADSEIVEQIDAALAKAAGGWQPIETAQAEDGKTAYIDELAHHKHMANHYRLLLNVTNKAWLRAAQAAVAGDMSDIRNRVELAGQPVELEEHSATPPESKK